MQHHKHWTNLWWAILQHFGRECKKTWGGEVIAVVVGGIAGAGTTFLRSHAQASFTDALIDGLITALLFFAIYMFVHLLRSPWLERKSEGQAPSLLDGLLGGVLFLMLLGGSVLICRMVAWDWRSEIVLRSPADINGKKSQELIDLETCKANYAALTKPEPKDSLRRRTIRLANEIARFWIERPTPAQSVQTPTNDEERKRNSESQKYWQDVTADYNARDFRDRLLNIIREYDVKGVPTWPLEAQVKNNGLFGASPFGGSGQEDQILCGTPVCELRELAFHVDGQDVRITPSF